MGKILVIYGPTATGKTANYLFDKTPNFCNTVITMIKRNTAVVSLSLPQQVLEDLNRWAKLERKSKSELIRSILKWYKLWKFKRDFKELRKLGEETRRKFGFKTEDDLYEYIHGD